ncbi:MAG: hypothetical protein JXQ87_02975 [Bacteroidia bacterium]
MSDLLDDHLIEDQNKKYKFNMSFALFWCALFFIGAIWRLMHWPGAGMILVGSAAGLMAYSISAVLTLKGKSMGNNFSIAIAFLLIIYYTFKVVRLTRFDFLVVYAIFLVAFFTLFQIMKIRWLKRNSFS